MKNIIKVPTQLAKNTTSPNSLSLDGYSVIEQCFHHAEEKGTLFLEEHVLFLILEGSLTLTYGTESFALTKHEMILLKKATVAQFEIKGNPDKSHIYDSLVFGITNEMLKAFLVSVEMEIPRRTKDVIKIEVCPMPECLITFAQSVKHYFSGIYTVHQGQLRLKIMEMLYNLAVDSHNMFMCMLEFQEPIPTDIRHIMEEHYTSPASLNELAYLSGRSLSSFKRDVQEIYNTTPAKWIREKRLNKAKELLETTQLSVSDICFSLGFENISHFSRVFKVFHGKPPSSYRYH
ncbi:AraC family transcriptional regulator [Chitinophaga pendula]|uniref:helix-turn-helix domain-containing protein n=1 Tax=Chitinophaga TaxID=79328 RepID=UPI000BAE9424|nr:MULTISPECIES: AraC family transcriptional regulator [Chitinophaga]ASZ13918.1 AraC family transcriptional regulator [Chitinophaga sp. MD30]UCJ08464.1 AraC family transcriptional regulator [Chitinophaga pendula]